MLHWHYDEQYENNDDTDDDENVILRSSDKITFENSNSQPTAKLPPSSSRSSGPYSVWSQARPIVEGSLC